MAGGSLIKDLEGVQELESIGLLADVNTKIHGAPSSGSTIIAAFREGIDWVKPQRRKTLQIPGDR